MIQASVNAFIVPSRFEPRSGACLALHAVPIVSRVGGLVDH
jgi:glycogen synthase